MMVQKALGHAGDPSDLLPHWCSISLSETNDMAKPLEEPVSAVVLTGDRQVEELE